MGTHFRSSPVQVSVGLQEEPLHKLDLNFLLGKGESRADAWKGCGLMLDIWFIDICVSFPVVNIGDWK